MFTQSFQSFVCSGDSIACEIDGFTLTATIHEDDTMQFPWDDCGHGPVSDWRSKDSKQPGERILNTDRQSCRFYDFAEAIRIANRDGWGTADGKREGETEKAYRARAVEHDFKVMKAWCDDEWRYVGLSVTVSCNDVELIGAYEHALWGVESNYPDSDNAYLTEVANELASEALDAAKAKLSALCACSHAVEA